MTKPANTAILLVSCPDRVGLVSRIAHFIFERGGNILNLDEHVDVDTRQFFLRIEWDMTGFSLGESDIAEAFAPLAKEFTAQWRVALTGRRMKAAVFVSKLDHCLQEILWRQRLGEFNTEIPMVISNHENLRPLVEQYGVAFHVVPITKENKADQERKELALLKESGIELVILARYMQILSPQFVQEYPNRIVNIHHSFLPAFVGSNPYRQAFDAGVKVIGATAHYVTKELDEGPIIEQDIVRISHKDRVVDLERKGRDLERLILARAVYLHAQHRILVHGRKTVVFD